MQENDVPDPQDDGNDEKYYDLMSTKAKYVYMLMKWKLHKTSDPRLLLDEVAMRVNDSEEYHLAHNIFSGLPRNSRLVFAFHYGDGLSVQEAANILCISESKAQKSIDKILGLLPNEDTLDIIIRFVKTEMRFAGEKCSDAATKYMRELKTSPKIAYGAEAAINTVDSSAIPAVMESVTQTVATVTETVAANQEQIVQTAVASAGTVITAVTSKAFSAAFMTFALLVLCPLSLAFGCRSIGDKIMQNAKTMTARRWIVKYFFYGYSTLMLFPLYFFGTTILVTSLPSKMRPVFFVLAATFALIFFVSYLVFVHLRYRFVQNVEEIQSDSDYEKLEKLVYRGSITLSVVLVVLLPIIVYSMVYKDMVAFFKTDRIQQGILMALFPLLLCGTLGSIHRGMILFFRYYLFLSRDQESAQKADEVIGPFFKKIQDELQNIVLFLILPIGANVAHLMFRWTHPLGALLELACYVPWWGLVIWLNIKNPKNRWAYIGVTASLQVLIMLYLRLYVYE